MYTQLSIMYTILTHFLHKNNYKVNLRLLFANQTLQLFLQLIAVVTTLRDVNNPFISSHFTHSEQLF